MNSHQKRQRKKRMCLKKVKYSTREIAEMCTALRIYECPHCKGFHATKTIGAL